MARRRRASLVLVVALVSGRCRLWQPCLSLGAPATMLRGVGACSGCRGSRAALRAVGLFFSTLTGRTAEVCCLIAEKSGLEPVDLVGVAADDLKGYDGLIVGVPTWNPRAKKYRSGTAFDDISGDIRRFELDGTPVAVYGCGDLLEHRDNFCDAIEEAHSVFQAAGARMLGYVGAAAYTHRGSRSEVGGKFLGLPLDEDNEPDLTDGRVTAWISQLKAEGMPL